MTGRAHVPRRWLVPVGAFAIALLVGSIWAATRTAPSPSPTPTPAAEGFLAQGYAELAREAPTAAPSSTSLWELLSAMLVPTLIVIVAAYATIRVLRTLNRRVAASVSRTTLLELVDTLPLAGSGVVHIVRLGERYLLLGAGSAGLSLLTELRPDEVALLRTHASDHHLAQALVPSFRELLGARLPRVWHELDVTSPPPPSPPHEDPSGVRFGHVPEQADRPTP
ncbi:MAG: flagellar biosynthetic protein FliO [Thermomicrobium sp.]|nr:flagellar biosynthetic protein FliO [Thermomicrobium sp.]